MARQLKPMSTVVDEEHPRNMFSFWCVSLKMNSTIFYVLKRNGIIVSKSINNQLPTQTSQILSPPRRMA